MNFIQNIAPEIRSLNERDRAALLGYLLNSCIPLTPEERIRAPHVQAALRTGLMSLNLMRSQVSSTITKPDHLLQ